MFEEIGFNLKLLTKCYLLYGGCSRMGQMSRL